MLKEFKDIVDQMPILFQGLKKSDLLFRHDLSTLPKAGVYVLYEYGKPICVGRSNRLKQRIQEHSRPSSTHNSAPFAFNLAKDEAIKKGLNVIGYRNVLEKEPKFDFLFIQAKQRVAKTQIQAININNQVTQTIFEVYTALALKTPYNDFTTH